MSQALGSANLGASAALLEAEAKATLGTKSAGGIVVPIGPREERQSVPKSDLLRVNAIAKSYGGLDYSRSLLPWKSNLENVVFGMRRLALSAQAKREKAAEVLASVGLGGFEKYYQWQTSGG
eukprot:gene41373-51092_t